MSRTGLAALLTIALLTASAVACGRQAPAAPDEPVAETASAEDSVEEPAPAPRVLVGGWSLDIPADLKKGAIPDGFSITIEFSEDGAVGGSSGCNRYHGHAEFSGDAGLSFGPMAATMMACPEAQMDLESSFLAILGGVSGFRMDKEKLELLKDDAAVLVFLPLE